MKTTEIIGLSLEVTPLKKIIQRMPNATKTEVKKMYGDIGVDIFEGKDKISILPEEDIQKSKTLVSKFRKWWSGNCKFEYEEKDTLKDLVLKYGCNNTRVTSQEIEEKFGQEGRRIANLYEIMGYFIRTGL